MDDHLFDLECELRAEDCAAELQREDLDPYGLGDDWR